jgi:hypothetical protein
MSWGHASASKAVDLTRELIKKEAAAIEEAATHCQELIVLGSYPRSKRIL